MIRVLTLSAIFMALALTQLLPRDALSPPSAIEAASLDTAELFVITPEQPLTLALPPGVEEVLVHALVRLQDMPTNDVVFDVQAEHRGATQPADVASFWVRSRVSHLSDDRRASRILGQPDPLTDNRVLRLVLSRTSGTRDTLVLRTTGRGIRELLVRPFARRYSHLAVEEFRTLSDQIRRRYQPLGTGLGVADLPDRVRNDLASYEQIRMVPADPRESRLRRTVQFSRFRSAHGTVEPLVTCGPARHVALNYHGSPSIVVRGPRFLRVMVNDHSLALGFRGEAVLRPSEAQAGTLVLSCERDAHLELRSDSEVFRYQLGAPLHRNQVDGQLWLPDTRHVEHYCTEGRPVEFSPMEYARKLVISARAPVGDGRKASVSFHVQLEEETINVVDERDASHFERFGTQAATTAVVRELSLRAGEAMTILPNGSTCIRVVEKRRGAWSYDYPYRIDDARWYFAPYDIPPHFSVIPSNAPAILMAGGHRLLSAQVRMVPEQGDAVRPARIQRRRHAARGQGTHQEGPEQDPLGNVRGTNDAGPPIDNAEMIDPDSPRQNDALRAERSVRPRLPRTVVPLLPIGDVVSRRILWPSAVQSPLPADAMVSIGSGRRVSIESGETEIWLRASSDRLGARAYLRVDTQILWSGELVTSSEQLRPSISPGVHHLAVEGLGGGFALAHATPESGSIYRVRRFAEAGTTPLSYSVASRADERISLLIEVLQTSDTHPDLTIRLGDRVVHSAVPVEAHTALLWDGDAPQVWWGRARVDLPRETEDSEVPIQISSENPVLIRVMMLREHPNEETQLRVSRRRGNPSELGSDDAP